MSVSRPMIILGVLNDIAGLSIGGLRFWRFHFVPYSAFAHGNSGQVAS